MTPNVSKRKIEKSSKLAPDEVQGDTLPRKDKKIDENQPGSSRRRSEHLSHLEKPKVEPPVACSDLEGCTLCRQCKSNSLQLYQKDAARKGLD